MRRRLLLLFAALFAVAVLLVLTIPLWLGLALRATPEKWGVKYSRYERIGYGRFALHDVEYQRGNVRVTVNRVESDSPLAWLTHRWASRPEVVTAGKWSVVVGPKTTPTAPRPESGWLPLKATLERIADKLEQWLPRASVGEGSVAWPGGGITLAFATWEKRTLTLRQLAYKSLKVDASAEFISRGDEIRLNASAPDNGAGIRLVNKGAAASGEISWREQRATLNGTFGARGWLPAQAVLQGDNWNIPAAKLKLGDQYAAVRGHGKIEWSDQHFDADLSAQGEPLPGKKAPPLEATVRGRGDVQNFTAQAVHVILPGITADLSAPVTIDRTGRFTGAAAKFTVHADLARQPWFEARGSVEGEAELAAGVAQMPVVDFRIHARDVAAVGVAAASVDGAGKLAWPRLQVADFAVVGASGERLQGRGGYDFRARELIDTSVEGEIRRATIARWLPAQPQFEKIVLKAQASGPVATVQHGGEATAAGVSFSGVKPLAVAVNWTGRGAALDRFSATASAAATKVSIAGALDAEGARIGQFEWSQGDARRLQLTQPAKIEWQPALHVEGLRLVGGNSSLDADLTWGKTGTAAFAIRNVPSSWLTDLVTIPGPAWSVTSLALTGNWANGPMKFSAVLGASIDLGEDRRAVVNLAGRGDEAGVRLEALHAAEGNESIINASGIVPVSFTPGGAPFVKVNEQAALQIDADTAPNAAFWQQLAGMTGLELKEPHAAVHLKGTWQRPEGDVRLTVDRIAADPKRFKRPLPTVEALQLALTGDRAGVRLDALTLRVEGQEVKAAGRLPVSDAEWQQAVKNPLAFAQRGADLKFEIPDADVAVFSRFLPSYLAPKGRLHVDVNYKSGDFSGGLRLNGASTRPLGPLGVLQDIEADLRLSGHAIEIHSITAKSGGEDVRLTGQVEIPPFDAKPAAAGEPPRLPKFDVALKGTNLPFVRRSGLLMRGDLDLKLTTPDRGSPRLSGNVKLRDSLFLQDIRALRPGGTRSVSRRPPYFSIDTPPLNTWRLDVTVEGAEFMRLRTTLFNGLASAKFHLGGTLEEPIAIGDATVDEGLVRLPFASFDVQEGRVTLTREQPYEPQLFVTATARRFSYDLRLEVTGPANAPVLAFSSSPPLEHGQILLMVMAGEAPKSEVTFTDQQRAARLGTFIGQSLLASLGDSESAERLSVSTGEKVSRQGRETYDIEYKLTNRWSVTGEYDEFDDFNAGVKWRVYTKGGRDDSAKKNEPAKP